MPPEGASHHYFDPPDERFHVRSRKEDLTEDAQARSTTIYPPTPIPWQNMNLEYLTRNPKP